MSREGVSAKDLNDGRVKREFCLARAWPDFFKMPPEMVVADDPVQEAEKLMFARGTWNVLYQYDSRDPIVDLLRVSNADGPKVLECLYGSKKKGWAAYHFWPGTPPSNIKALLAADRTGKLRFLGTKALRKCPATQDEALNIRLSAMKETGFPPK